MNELTSLITGVGFPIAVAIYLLVIMRQTLEALTKVINENTKMLSRICEHLNIVEKVVTK